MTMDEERRESDFEQLLEYLRERRGVDFTGYKRATLLRRVQRRMELLRVSSVADYLVHLTGEPLEFSELFNFLLINVTDFFRDSEAWAYLAETITPRILAQKQRDEPIRVWSAGCATGQEAYSLAMMLGEAIGDEALRERVKIYATDIDDDALNQARIGVYSAREVEHLPAPMLEKYFQHTHQRYAFRKDLRRVLIFGRNDLVQDAPISRLDLLLCRNLLMYFTAETQGMVLQRLHFAVNDSGFLMLGKAEMLLSHTNLFAPVDLRHRVFTKVPRPRMRDRLAALLADEHEAELNTMTKESRVRLRVFNSAPNAQIVVDNQGRLTMVNERAAHLFGMSPRDIGRPAQDFEVFYRPVELRNALGRSFAEETTITFQDVSWPSGTGEQRWYDVNIISVTEPNAPPLGALVVFNDVTQLRRLHEQLQHSNEELETAYEELQATNEELETTNEELQSTIEELETTNEELQSTNEELETINEEMQSTNEELETLNNELRRSSEELNNVNGFMESIFANLPSAVVVLDREQRVQVWSQLAENLWGVRGDEAVGRHLMNLDIGLPVERLKHSIRSCLSGESNGHMELLPATNRRGKAIHVSVRCLPLRYQGDTVSGALIVMEERQGQAAVPQTG